MTIKPQNFLVVTGLSGAGISSALKHLEDMGYEVFDNFPPGLIASLMQEAGKDRPVAVGIDARARGFSEAAIRSIVREYQARLLFLTADTEALQRRFKETRRKHPLAKDRPVSNGIKAERELLFGLREDAEFLVDTTDLSIHDLRRVLEGHFAAEGGKLSITLMSFGFKYGIPRDADIMMDIRFLKNPYWDEKLRPLTGHDKPVGEYIEKDEHYAGFLKSFQDMIKPLLPLYENEGKSYLTIAIGCTGGRHRSVYTVEKLKNWLGKQDTSCHTIHRDLDKA